MNKNKHSTLFVYLSVLFVACLITSNVIAVKIISVFGLTLPAGIVVFPIVYIINDVLTEVYGFKKAKLAITLGFVANLIFVLGVLAAINLPSAIFWEDQFAFVAILGFTPRLLVASLVAYLIGSTANAWVMDWMKKLTQGKWLWTRTISSTIVGEGLDSLIFLSVAFAGNLPPIIISSMILTQWLFKVCYEAVITPVTYKVVNFAKKTENL